MGGLLNTYRGEREEGSEKQREKEREGEEEEERARNTGVARWFSANLVLSAVREAAFAIEVYVA